MVVYGQDCLDEISLSAPTSVCEIKDGTFEEYVITPEEFGMTRCTKEELVGGTPQENAEITKEILAGKKGPARDAVVLNAAAALHVAKEIPMQDAVKTGRGADRQRKSTEKNSKSLCHSPINWQKRNKHMILGNDCRSHKKTCRCRKREVFSCRK